MTIETKYSVGDQVWMLTDTYQPILVTIKEVYTTSKPDYLIAHKGGIVPANVIVKIVYLVRAPGVEKDEYAEEVLFESKQALQQHIMQHFENYN